METEDTQDSSKADAAAIKRKRRSSILKNQRPPRTPFSEVEFNVTTPPDTTKSRRVSFSRRTGVAEFVTNEATTTWRNFYEEHNKSLESSGNENNLVENAPRQTIEHIGKRIFDQQFEEVEAVDLGGTIHTNPLQQFQASFNKINLTQELASLECMTGDLKFVPSQSKFEQSALTELSKPFGNDMQCPVLEDMTDPLSMNFSTMQPLSSSKCDDLDEIQNDLERSKPSAMCPGPMNPGKDFSGYIEVADLDVTHGVIHNDGSEMSITDTIESPKVQDAAKSSVQQSKHKLDDDWTNDKENMVFNPYVAPKESLTFAVNKVSDEVLVFDGKRLTTQSITSNISENKENFRQTLLPNAPANAPQRKTIILDVNDDLPNFIDNNSSKSNFNLHVSSMQPTDKAFNVQSKTDTAGNNKSMANDTIDMCDTSDILSFTQAISSNIIAAKRESLHVKHCNDMIQNISMTQPNNIIQIDEENKLQTDNNEKRRTIIFAGESCDISMTQSLQSNVNFNSEKISATNGNTIIFDNNAHDISITQVLPTNIHVNITNNDQHDLKNKNEKYATTQKRKTVLDEDSCNISITQAGPVNIIGINSESNNGLMSGKDSEKRRTIIFDHESCDISMTQALPTNINLNKENEEINYNIYDDKLTGYKNSKKRNTIIFDTESCDISLTQALPTNINLIENVEKNNEIDKNIENKSSEKRRTIIFDKDSCDISMTQALPTTLNILEQLEIGNEVAPNENSEKRRTIIFDKESCDISLTQAIPTNIDLIQNFERSNEINKRDAKEENFVKRRTIIFDKESCDISLTQAIPTNINLIENFERSNEINERGAKEENSEKRRTIIFDKESCDISLTQAIPTNMDFVENLERCNEINEKGAKEENSEKRRTIIFDKESCDISLTQAIPTNIGLIENLERSNEFNKRGAKEENSEKRRTIIFDKESCDISLTQAIPTNINLIENFERSNEINKRGAKEENSEKRRTIIFDKEFCDISLTQAIPTNMDFVENFKRSNEMNLHPANEENSEKRRTIIFGNDLCDISMTQALPTNIDLIENLERNDEINKMGDIEGSGKRRTIILSKDLCDISMTQALPSNINLIENLERSNEINNRGTNEEISEKRRTIIFDKDSCNMSVTQALPINIDLKENIEKKCKEVNEIPEKRNTIIFDKNSFDVAMTQALPTNITFDGENIKRQSVFDEKVSNNMSEKRHSIIFDHESCDISMTRALPTNSNIFNKESMDKVYESDIKLELENQSATICDRISDQFISEVIANHSLQSESKENKNVSQLAPTEKRKTISVFDNNCISSDHNHIEKTNQTQNMEVTDLCKTIQPNMFRHEDNKNTNISLSNSVCHKNLDAKETSYSHVNKCNLDVEYYVYEKNNIDDEKHSLVNKTLDDIDFQKDVLSPLNKENNNKTLEHKYDQTSQYLAYEPEYKTNVYQADTNKQINKTSTDICKDELGPGMDVDEPVKLYNLQNNTTKEPGPRKSILNELLNMSCDSVKHDLSKFYENDDLIHGTEAVKDDSVLMSASKEINCKESSLVERKITQKDEIQPVIEIKNNGSVILLENQANENYLNESYKESHTQIKYKIEKESEGKEDLTKYNMELEESVKFIAELNSSKTFKSVKEADNTKDLLKMLSEITDEDGEECTSKQENVSTKGEDYVKPSVAEKNTIATKGTLQEPKRLSLAPRRHSIAISREDLLNNISMAKAALQQSRFEVDETDIMDDTSELMETHEINDTYTSNRMNNEVVKTLRFEDESASDTSIKSEIKMNPLRKSAVEEIPSINDKKVKVIPTFLNDVSVSLKDLMHDLVKPNLDAPFENNFIETNVPSTCNAEVETNFITSSQIDVSQEEPSQCFLKNSDNFISKGGTKSVGLEVKYSVNDSEPINIVQHTKMPENIVKCNVYDITQSSPQKYKHESLVFNSDNPLKNVLLPPIDYTDAHKYNQFREEKGVDDTKRKSSHKIKELDENSFGSRLIENDVLKDQKIAEQMNIVCGLVISERSGVSSLNANVCKPICADKSVESVVPYLKDTEVNTMIVMKKNRDLIQSSSLTMVDETLTDSEFKMNIEPSTEPSSEKDPSIKVSHVKILFRNENNTKFIEKDSDATSSEEISNIDLDAKTRKRSYSPTSTNSYVLSNVEVTPKPTSKMQKMSNSPLTKSTNNKVDTNIMQVDLDADEMKSPKHDESKIKSAAHTEIIQKVEVQYNNYSKLKSKPIQISQSTKFDKEKASENKENLKLSSESALQDPSVTISQVVTSATSRIVTPLEEERKNKIEKDYGPDVIENVKLLSFMGTSECEWERCGRADVWAFRLLCGRVRLSVRLHSAAVRADTPVSAVDVEIAKADEKDAIAALCVSLAMEAMRYEAADVSRADAVAALLRRCVRVSRLARRWARAMRDAHARLAYHVMPNGQISLKVANLPLRRVVEARLHVSLAVERERGAAYPCADRVALAGAGAGAVPASGADLARLADQPPDWGHVPRTIWKVFKYLKNRTRTEDLLGN